MKRTALVVLCVTVFAAVFPERGYGYREGEDDQEVDADIARGERAFVGRLAEAGERVVGDIEQALRAEERRDIELLKGRGSPPMPPQKDDDSIAEIEREVDALTAR